MKNVFVGVGTMVTALGLTGCGPIEVSRASVAPAPDTAVVTTVVTAPTSAESTGQATTTAPSTTSAPPSTTEMASTPTSNPLRAMQADAKRLEQTHDEFHAEVDACFADPEQCDEVVLVDKFTAPDETGLRPVILQQIERRRADGTVIVSEGYSNRQFYVTELELGSTFGTTLACEASQSFEADRSILSGAPTTAPSFEPEYIVWYLGWEHQPDGRWLIVAAHVESSLQPDDLLDEFELDPEPEHIAACLDAVSKS